MKPERGQHISDESVAVSYYKSTSHNSAAHGVTNNMKDTNDIKRMTYTYTMHDLHKSK